MPNPENVTKHSYKPGECGNPKGRPKNRVQEWKVKILGKKQARDFHDMSASEYEDWCHMLLVAPTSALQALVKADETPSLVKGYAMAILQDTKAGKTTTVARIAEKLFGGATRKVELTGPGGSDLIPARTLTKDEAAELLAQMEKDF